MTNQFKFFALFFFLIQGCSTAQQATEVNAVKFSVAPYLKMDCQSLSMELNKLYRDASISSNQVDERYNKDKNAEVVAWVLFWPAAFALEGNQEEAAKLASIKGQIDAIQDALVINGCEVRYDNSRYENSRYTNEDKNQITKDEPRTMRPSKPSKNPGIYTPFGDK